MPDETTTAFSFDASQDPAAPLAPGYILAKRYRIVRLAGQGGMGQVYEAEDLELAERVALKVIRAAISGERAIERFKREIQLARKVTHPNVCRIFDLAYHESTATSPGNYTFLTMEYLPGETLAARLRREGRIPFREALPIIEQMAAALECAHQAGIIHRDFKSANVILVPLASSGCRAVVTDFGLARSQLDSTSAGHSISVTGALVGTPAYMAPEQVRSSEAGAPADIYALGVVMYEMAAGTLPFSAGSPIYTALQRLKEPPPRPSVHAPDVDPNWEKVILRCLEIEPADRFQTAADVTRALQGEEVAAHPRRRGRTARRTALAAAGLAILLLIAAALYFLQPLRTRQIAGGVRSRPSVAVLGFKNLSGRAETAWLSTALSEMLTTELAAGGKLRAIPGENVARMRIELAVSDANGLAQDTLARIRRNIGSDLVVLGAYTDLGPQGGGRIRLDVQLQDAASGELISSVAETGTEADLFNLLSRTGAALRSKLGIGSVTADQAITVQASLPANSKAARLYAEGLDRLRLFDAVAARQFLEQATAADPQYPLAHSALSAAWASLGYDANAAREAQRAFELSNGLPRAERLSVEARYREAKREWDRAVEIYRTLFAFFPDDLEYGLRLASTQISAGHGKDALVTIESLRKLPPPSGDDPRISLQEAWAAQSQSDFKRAQAAARAAAGAGEARGTRLFVARARLTEASVLRSVGDLKAAIAVCEQARNLFAAAGDHGGVAGALNSTANALADLGDFGGARKLYEEALEIHEKLGNKSGMAGALDNIANVLVDQGEPAGAKQLSEKALALYTEIDQKNGIADTLNNIAGELWLEGDLSGAKTYFEKSLAIRREIGDKGGIGTALNNIGDMLVQEGNIRSAKTAYTESLSIFRETGQRAASAYPLFGLGQVLSAAGESDDARRSYEEAMAVCRETGDKHELAYATAGLAALELQRGDFAAAKKRHEEALAIRRELGEKGAIAESQVGLAEVALAAGRPADAEPLAREAAAEFGRERQADSEALARTVLAAVLGARGNTAAARRESTRAGELLEKTQGRRVRLKHAIVAARLQAASNDPRERASVRKSLEAALTEASRSGLVEDEFEAQFALGEIEAALGRGRGRLDALARDAKSRGFTLIAQKAARAGK